MSAPWGKRNQDAWSEDKEENGNDKHHKEFHFCFSIWNYFISFDVQSI
jgi:hypothetical protein